jgi:hypothetical protein
VRFNRFFTVKTVDHVEAEVRTPQRAEKRLEGPRKESRVYTAVRLKKLELARAGKPRKGRKLTIRIIFRNTWLHVALLTACPTASAPPAWWTSVELQRGQETAPWNLPSIGEKPN